jgi:hypothetical protein
LDGGVEPHPVVQFAAAARCLSAAARAAGLVAPAFRSPPRHPRAVRTIRRLPGGTVVAVQVKRRPFDAVQRDMIEGVIAANRLQGEAAARVRRMLHAALSTPNARAAA